MRTVRAVLLCLCLLLPLAPLTAAEAGPCTGDHASLYLFTRAGVILGDNPTGVHSVGNPTVTPKAVGCDTGMDARYIYPGSTMLSVRFADDAGVPVLVAQVQGLAMDAVVELRQAVTPAGSAMAMVLGPAPLYDSPWIPLDPREMGRLRITLYLPSGPIVDDWWTVA